MYAWERSEIHTKFWPKSLKGRDHMGDQDTDERIILRWSIRK
jgi:hypothetical protein